MSSPSATSLNVPLLVGPVILSLVASSILYGCALVQAYVYTQNFPRDKRRFKVLVALEMALQTVHIGLLVQGVWDTVVVNYNQPLVLLTLTNNTIVGITLGSPSAFFAQAFFIFRLYTFSRRRIIPIICTILIVVQFVFTLGVGIAAYGTPSATTLIEQWRPIITFGLFISIAGDTAVAAGMSYYLRAKRPQFGRTSRLVNGMLLYIVATGVTTSVIALAAGITFTIMPTNYIWLSLYIMESGLYTNSLLAALNSRAYLRNRRDSEAPTGTLSFMPPTQTTEPGSQDEEANKIAVHVTLERTQGTSEVASDKGPSIEPLEVRRVTEP